MLLTNTHRVILLQKVVTMHHPQHVPIICCHVLLGSVLAKQHTTTHPHTAMCWLLSCVTSCDSKGTLVTNSLQASHIPARTSWIE